MQLTFINIEKNGREDFRSIFTEPLISEENGGKSGKKWYGDEWEK